MKDKFKEPVDKPGDIQPITTEHEWWEDGLVIDTTPVEQPELVKHMPTFWDRVKRDLSLAGTRIKLTGKNIFTFNFVRHFIFGAGIAAGTVFKFTGWSLVTLATAVAGGLAGGIRKSWSDAGVSVGVKKGDLSRVWKELWELIVAILDWWISKRKEGRNGD